MVSKESYETNTAYLKHIFTSTKYDCLYMYFLPNLKVNSKLYRNSQTEINTPVHRLVGIYSDGN